MVQHVVFEHIQINCLINPLNVIMEILDLWIYIYYRSVYITSWMSRAFCAFTNRHVVFISVACKVYLANLHLSTLRTSIVFFFQRQWKTRNFVFFNCLPQIFHCNSLLNLQSGFYWHWTIFAQQHKMDPPFITTLQCVVCDVRTAF